MEMPVFFVGESNDVGVIRFGFFAVTVSGVQMGCSGSKVEDLPLVTLCRERKEYLKAASEQRYALAAAHVSYFQSLKSIGDALRRFADEELVIGGGSSSLGSPVLTLPSDEGKGKRNKAGGKSKDHLSSSASISHSCSISEEDHFHGEHGDIEDPHLRLSSGSDSDSELHSGSGHIHMEDSRQEEEAGPEASSYGYAHAERPPYGYAPAERPPYGYAPAERPPYGYAPGDRPPYGYAPAERPSYGYAPAERPSYGYAPAERPSYGYAPAERPSYGYAPTDWNSPQTNYYAYSMKRSTAPAHRLVFQEPETHTASMRQWPEQAYGYQGSASYGNGGFFGVPFASSPPSNDYKHDSHPNPPTSAPPIAPPSPPKLSTWDFLNVFDSYDASNYPGYYSQGRYGLGSSSSSTDSKEVREREGIPELEDETEHELLKAVDKQKKKVNGDKGPVKINDFGEGTSKALPSRNSSEGSSKHVPLHRSENPQSVQEKEIKPVQEKDIKSSPDSIVSGSCEEEFTTKKGVSFDVDEAHIGVADGESSKLSSLTTLSPHGTRDIQEVVKEIRDEFEVASSYGKEVAMLLEAGKMPYRSHGSTIKVIFSRILYLVAPSMLVSRPEFSSLPRFPSKTMKTTKAYSEEAGEDTDGEFANLSSTLEKLYVWERKLYNEVKDEEKLRIIYEKECKRLKMLDDRGAESSKIDATRTSIRKLLTKINVSIRSVDAVASRIHKLRDEELEPQLAQLIHGLIRMWRYMLKCHQKQFQAIMESKTRLLKVNTGLQRDAGLKAVVELERELLDWCTQFNNWVKAQKSYIGSLYEWLMRCLHHEPEVTPDGVVPFSPSRIGAPPIFVMCNDWYQAMTRVSEQRVADAMHDFAGRLHELWARQDEEQRQRTKAEYLSKDFHTRVSMLRMNAKKTEDSLDELSDRSALSKVPSDNGVLPMDDLKVDLDLLKKKLQEEKARHREAIKLVHDAASNSLQAGLVPIFKTLESFTSDAVQAHEQVRLQNAEVS